MYKQKTVANNRQGSFENKLSPQMIKILERILFQSQNDTNKKDIEKLNRQLKQMKFPELLTHLSDILNTEQKMNMTLRVAHIVITKCLEFGIYRIFLCAYICIVSRNKHLLNNNIYMPRLKQLINEIDDRNLGYFCQAFSIQISDKKLQSVVTNLTKQHEYNSALRLISSQKINKEILQIIANQAKFQKDKQVLNSIICELIRMGFGKQDFPQLHQQGLRIQMMELYNEEGYQVAEEVFRYNPKMMTTIIDKMIKDNKPKRQILSVCRRNQHVIKFLKDKSIQNQLNHFIDYKPNSLQIDTFGPSDKKKYFSLADFNISQDKVHFLTSSTPDLEMCLIDIIESKIIGLDTQSYVARTKFSTDQELIATIQISNGKNVYIFDAKDIKNPLIGESLVQFFCNPQKILVGHTLLDDLQVTLKALGIKKKAECKCVDVKEEFKNMNIEGRRGLAQVSQKILGKQICKQYTLTDWGRRPLLLNQLHYAALDAVIVIQIYKKMQKIVNDKQNKK